MLSVFRLALHDRSVWFAPESAGRSVVKELRCVIYDTMRAKCQQCELIAKRVLDR
jgi:hypothetical protein